MEVVYLKNRKFKRGMAFLLVLAMLCSIFTGTPKNERKVSAATVWNGYVATKFEAGTGTKDNPYQIKWGSQLAFLAENVRNGETYENQYFVLTADIILNDTADYAMWSSTTTGLKEWNAIGSYVSPSDNNPFAGTFNGEGHIVSGLFSCNKETNGLFAYNKGTIKDLIVEKSYIEGSGYGVGSITGRNDGVILNCKAGSKVISVWADENNIEAGSVGGVAGTNNGTITLCSNYGEVDGVGVSGGIVGTNINTVRNCYNTGIVGVSVLTQYGTGGIAGCNSKNGSVVENCYNLGEVSATNYAGGIVGTNIGSIHNCYNQGDVDITRADGYEGSIAGALERSSFDEVGSVSHTYWKDTVNKPVVGYAGAGSVDDDSCYKYNSSNELLDENDSPASVTFTIDGMPSVKNNLTECLDAWTQAVGCGNKDVAYERWVEGMFAGAYADVWDGTTASAFGGGDGSEGAPYRITNGSHLRYLANQVNSGNSYSGTYFVLASDILLNNETFEYDDDTGLVCITDGVNTGYLGTGIKGIAGGNTEFDTTPSVKGTYYEYNGASYSQHDYTGTINEWTPIGSASKPFAGEFDGKGYKISGVVVQDYANCGLFGYVSDGNISNLNLDNSCYVSNSGGYMGSIAGYVAGNIVKCSAKNVVLATADTEYAGGIAGYLADAVINSDGSYNTDYEIFDSLFNGTIVGAGRTGGIAGYSGCGAVIDECYVGSTALVAGNGLALGGIVGKNYGATIINSYVLGNVKATDTISYVGGIAGENASEGKSCIEGYPDIFGNVINCYVTASEGGAVSGIAGAYTGGIVGFNIGGGIVNSYSDIDFSGDASDFIGGIAGVNSASEGSYILHEGLTTQKYKSFAGTISYSYGNMANAELCGKNNCGDDTVDSSEVIKVNGYQIVNGGMELLAALNDWRTAKDTDEKCLEWTYPSGKYPMHTGTRVIEDTEVEPLPQYELSYDMNCDDATGSIESKLYELNEDITVEENVFVREGYNFVEWNTSEDGSGDSYDVGDTITIDKNTTLYAVWVSTQANITDVSRNGDSVTVTWDAVDDADGYWIYRYKLVDDADVFDKFKVDDKIDEVLVPEVGAPASYSYQDTELTEGTYYYGVRAYTIASGSGATATYVFKPFSEPCEVIIEANTITYDGNGSTSGTVVPGVFINGTEAVIATNEYVNNGYEFVEWNTQTDGKGTSYAEEDTFDITSDMTLYAIWKLAPISDLTASINELGQTELTWSHSQSPLASGYNVYCSVGDELNYEKIATLEKGNSASMKYITDKLEAAKTYYYRVAVYQESSFGAGTYSEESEYAEVYVTSNAAVRLDDTKGLVEDGVNTGIDGNKVYLTWNVENDVTGYEVYRSTSLDAGSEELIGTINGSVNNTYTDEVPAEGTYYYAVRTFTEVRDANQHLDRITYGVFSQKLKVDIERIVITFNSNTVNRVELRTQPTGKNFTVNLIPNMFVDEEYTKWFEFDGWNSKADKSGDFYADEAECSFTEDITLYAVWKLATPTNLAAALLDNSLKLTWDTNMEADGYKIYQKKDDGEFECIDTIVSNRDTYQNYEVTELDFSSSYSYYIQGYINEILASGQEVIAYSNQSETVLVEPAPAPEGTVTDVQYVINPNGNNGAEVKFTWSGVTGATGYHVYRSTDSNMVGDKVADVTGTEYLDTEIKADEPGSYYYRIRAYSADDNGIYYKQFSKVCEVAFESVKITYDANGAQGTMADQIVIKGASGVQVEDCQYTNNGYEFVSWDYIYKTDIDEDGNNDEIDYSLLDSDMTLTASWKLKAVSRFNAVLNDDNTISMSWDANPKATGYDIYQRIGMNGNYECIDSVTGTTYEKAESVEDGTTYSFYVVPYVDIDLVSGKLKSEGIPSEEVAITLNLGEVPEGKVLNLDSTVNGDKVTLTWDAVQDVDGYYIYRSEVSGNRGECIATINGGDTVTYVDDTVEAVDEYYYSVRAFVIEQDVAEYYKPWSDYEVAQFVKYTITYVANNETTEVSNQDFVTGSEVVIKDNTFAYTGREFVSWNTDKLGKGYEYISGDAYSIDGDVTLYAIWKLEKPTNVNAELTDDRTSVTVSWNKVNGADGYLVSRKSEDGVIEDIGTTQSLSYTDFNEGNAFAEDDIYYYYVRAYENIDESTKRFSDYSETTSSTIIGNGSVPTESPLGAVTNLTVLEYYKDTAKFGWSGIPAADGYLIYYSEEPDGEKKYATIDTKASNVVTDTLKLDVTYYFYVVPYMIDVATNNYILGDYSESVEILITSTPAPTEAPTPLPTATPNPYGKVKNLKADILSDSSIRLSWDELENMTNYRVYTADNIQGDNIQRCADVTSAALTIDNIVGDREYYYCVEGYAVNEGANVVFSEKSDMIKVIIAGPTATPVPTQEPTTEPSEEPTAGPSEEPTAGPSEEPTTGPSEEPTAGPSEEPTTGPSEEPTAGPSEEPTAEPTAVPEPTPTPDPTKVSNVLIKDAYRDFINLIWTGVENSMGYEISYSTSIDGEKYVLDTLYTTDTVYNGIPVTGAAFSINENINASIIEGYNQNADVTYYYFVRAILDEGFGTYSDAVVIDLNKVDYNTPTPQPTVVPTQTPQATLTPAPTEVPKVSVGDKVTVGKLVYKVKANKKAEVVKPVKKTLTKVTIPATIKIKGEKYKVTSIKKSAFAKNKKLKKVTIGSNVTSIGAKAFSGCSKLNKVTFKSTKITKIGKKALNGITKKCKFVIPKTVLKKYRKLIKNTK